MSTELIADRFRRVYAADAAAGRIRSLSSYQRMFKGFETVVEREFAALSAAPQTPSPGRPGGDVAAIGPVPPAAELLARLTAGGRPRYRRRGEIARGGMGAVLRVRDDVLSRDLAMKVILPGPGTPTSEPMTERFVTEARVTAHLDHPGVVPIHELGIDAEGCIYFTMKLVGGRTLAEILDLVRGGGDAQWTTQRATALLIRVCDTLAFAHSRGVIHRDVKPANVMVGDFGEVYLMDWGLAKVLGEAEMPRAPAPGAAAAEAVPPVQDGRRPGPLGATQNITQAGSVLGTAGYISPEQARGRLDEVGTRTDVFSVGAILYEVLTGAAPYAGADGRIDSRAAMLAVVAGPPAPIRRSGIPEELVAIAEKAMARDPADRYPDAAALSRDLQDFADGRVVRAYRTGPFVEAVKWTKRNRALAAAVGAAFVLLVVGLATNASLLAESRRETARAKQQVFRTNLAAAAAALRDHDAPVARMRLAEVGDAASRWECRVFAARFDDSVGVLPGRAARFDREGRLLVIRDDGVLVRVPGVGAKEEVLLDPAPLRVSLASRDGRWAATGTVGAGLHWSGRSVIALAGGGDVRGREVLQLPDTPYVGFHPERSWLYWVEEPGVVHAFDLESGREFARREFPGIARIFGAECVPGVAAARDGVLPVATGRNGGCVQLVDAATLAPLGELGEHTESACADVAPRTALAVTASMDDSVRGWDLGGGAPRAAWTLRGLTDPTGVALSPDGTTLAVVPQDGTLRLYDAATGVQRVVLHGPPRGTNFGSWGDVRSVDFSPDGGRIVTLQRGPAVLWDATALDDPRVLSGHRSFVYDVAFSPDGALLASAGWDGYVGAEGGLRVWDAASGDLVAAAGDKSMYFRAVAWSADGARLHASGARTETFEPDGACLDAATAQPLEVPPGLAWNLHFSPSGDRAAACVPPASRKPSGDDAVRLSVLDLASGRTVSDGVQISGENLEVRFLGEGLLAHAAGSGGTIRVLDARTLDPRFELVGHVGTPWAAILSPDGARIVTGADDGTARVWDATTGAEVAVLPGHGTGALCAEYSRDGRLLAVGGRDGLVHLWDAATYEEIVTFSGHTNYVKDLAFSPDGETLASASGDGTIRIWSPEPLAVRLAARRERRRLVAELSPRVSALLGVPGDFDAVASAAAATLRADASLTRRAREVALQCLFAESLARRAKSAAPTGK